MSAERTLLAGIASVLTAAGSIAKVANGPRVLLAKLGWDLPPGVDDIGLAGLDMASVGTRLTTWSTLAADPEASTADQSIALADLAETVVEVLADLGDLRLEAPQDYLDRSGIKDDFLTRLLDLYLIQSAAVASRPVFDVAVLLGWFELQQHDADPATFQVAHLRHIVRWDRVPMLLSDPTDLLRETYGWGTTTFDADALVTRLGGVLQHLAAEVSRRELPAIPLARLHGGTPPAHQPQIQLFLPLLGSSGPLTGEAGISVFGLPPTALGAIDGGLGLAPYAEGTASLRIPLSSTLSIGMAAQADLGSGLALVLRPGSDPVLRTGLNEPQSGTGGPGAEVQLDLTLAVPPGAAAMTLLEAGGAKIEAASVALAVSVLVDDNGTDATLRVQFQGGRLTLTPEGLPFLEGVPPTDGLVVDADVDLSWSHRNGVRLNGRAELKTSRAIGSRIGLVTLDFLEIGLATSGSGVAFTAAVSATVNLGPVRLIVDQIGVQSAITPGPGSLGSADLTVRPTPPSGIGVAIDAPSVAGGGFLRFDPQKEEYSGMLELQIAETIAVKAIGLLTTRLPDGAKGYSLVVIIFVEDFKPIQLGLGFALTSIGGLLAINRTFDEAALRTGLKNHTLDSILFPQGPIRNAPQILSTLQTVFPAKSGRYVFGPMVTIGWGTPTIITAELGIFFEFPSPLRVVLLGQLRALLPSEKKPLVRLHMDALGVIDLGQKTASLDATLYDSKLGQYTLSGDMAFRLSWGSNSTFVLAVGGVHPAYTPPPGFPTLNRLALNLTSGKNPRVRLECYVAITSNTVQVGARVDLYAAAAGFSIEGCLSVDALFQFSPFRFVFEIRADVSLKRGKRTLMSVALAMTLEGPSPWHVKGKATFKVLFFKASVSFDKTFGKTEPIILPVVDPLPQLVQALADPRNWSAQLPGTGEMMVSLRSLPASARVRMHPLGDLTVRQRVLPLNVELSKFGNTTLSGDRRFTLTTLRLNRSPIADTDTALITEAFAPAQFIDMSDSEKLSRASFEPMQAGLRLGSDAVTYGGQQTPTVMTTARMEYKTFLKTGETSKPRPDQLYQPSAAAVKALTSRGAVGRSPLRRKGGAKYVDATTLEAGSARVNVVEPGFVIASRETLEPLAEMKLPTNATYTQAREELQRYLVNHPNQRDHLQVVCQHDLAPGGAP